MPEPIALDDYLETVRASLATVPGVATAQLDGLLDEATPSPVVLIWPTRFEDREETGTSEWHAAVFLEVIVMVSRIERTSRVDAMRLALALAQHIRWNTWGLEMGPAFVSNLERGNWDLNERFGEAWELATLEVAQEAVWWVGDEEPDPAIDTVWLGRAPNIGTGHEDDYTQIIPDPSDPPEDPPESPP